MTTTTPLLATMGVAVMMKDLLPWVCSALTVGHASPPRAPGQVLSAGMGLGQLGLATCATLSFYIAIGCHWLSFYTVIGCQSTLSLAVIGCHSLGIYTVICCHYLSLLS